MASSQVNCYVTVQIIYLLLKEKHDINVLMLQPRTPGVRVGHSEATVLAKF